MCLERATSPQALSLKDGTSGFLTTAPTTHWTISRMPRTPWCPSYPDDLRAIVMNEPDSAKKPTELDLAGRLLTRLGYHQCSVQSGPEAPDVIAALGSRRVGIEVTQLHSDE